VSCVLYQGCRALTFALARLSCSPLVDHPQTRLGISLKITVRSFQRITFTSTWNQVPDSLHHRHPDHSFSYLPFCTRVSYVFFTKETDRISLVILFVFFLGPPERIFDLSSHLSLFHTKSAATWLVNMNMQHACKLLICGALLDQELISYRYLGYLVLIVVVWVSSSKKPIKDVVSNRIGMKFGRIVFQVNTESGFWYDVIIIDGGHGVRFTTLETVTEVSANNCDSDRQPVVTMWPSYSVKISTNPWLSTISSSVKVSAITMDN